MIRIPSLIAAPIAALLACLALGAATAGSAWAATEVNRASQAELETVKGIGPALSAKILAARQQAPFKDWADLQQRVAGIGAGNAARMSQAGLTVGGSAYAASDASNSAAASAAASKKSRDAK